MKTTQQRHARRIQRVIDHIHNHSAEDIDSAAIAEVAQLSAYHWHRIYVAVTGESAVATVRRVRLVDITECAPWRLVGLWHKGHYHEIGRVFEKIMAAAEIDSWPRSEAFTVGVYFDDPDVVLTESCRSFAGIPVIRDFLVPDGYHTQEVTGGLHATCLHTGPYALLPESYRWLYREWLRGSSHDVRDNPCHEIYLNTPYNTPPAALETLICLPLEGKDD